MLAPPATPFESSDLPPAARLFYADNRRVANGLLHDELEVEIDAVHAGAHVGRRARVVGFIAGTHRSEGAIYLNLGPDWRRDRLMEGLR